MTIRRAVGAVLILLLLAVAYTAYEAWRVERDLSRAQSSGKQLITAVRNGDTSRRETALSQFTLSSRAAHRHTSGFWWGGLTHLPIVGDDASGLRALSSSLDTVASQGVQPMIDSVDTLNDLDQGGRIDVAKVKALQAPVEQAHLAFQSAAADIDSQDSSGYAGPIKTRFRTYQTQLDSVNRAVASANTAVKVMPGFLGGEGPRNYLFVFQNNAEIRATGGIPGAWAEVHADDGKMSIVRQGTAAQFGRRDTPILPLSDGELAVYSDLLGTFFQDANFTPDFPRSAQLWRARWQEEEHDQLDGVVSIDPVALSYLLNGTGPVTVDGVRLTASNAVSELLNKPYIQRGTAGQDKFFADAAKAIFEAATGHLSSPTDFVRGMSRAASEHRLYVASFTSSEAQALEHSQVIGALSTDDGSQPHVFVGLGDATGSKMSYYLRYHAEVTATSCQSPRQALSGTMTLSQTISSAQAQKLPTSVTGMGAQGIAKGSQLVVIRLYGPTGGSISNMMVDGATAQAKVVQLNNRPVVTLVALLSGPKDVVVSWRMQTGPGQTGSGSLGITPSVVPGSGSSTFSSAC